MFRTHFWVNISDKDGYMIDRREFLKMAACLGTSFGLLNLPGAVQSALRKIENVPRLVYLQAQSCTGCSISLLQAESPGPVAMITQYSKLSFHADLSATSGKQALDLIDTYISGEAGDYFLAVEGAIPWDMPEACMLGEKPFADYLTRAADTMGGAVAVGTCAAHGGIPAAEGNLTGAVSLGEFYKRKKDGPPGHRHPRVPGASGLGLEDRDSSGPGRCARYDRGQTPAVFPAQGP